MVCSVIQVLCFLINLLSGDLDRFFKIYPHTYLCQYASLLCANLIYHNGSFSFSLKELLQYFLSCLLGNILLCLFFGLVGWLVGLLVGGTWVCTC
jgi:hypothetical protein